MNGKVLLCDIETAPLTVHSWGLRDLTLGLNQIVEDPRIMGFGAKWLDGGKARWWSEYHHGREAMLQKAYELIDKADVVSHFNGKSFDMKWFNAEFGREGMEYPSPYKQIDLYSVVRQNYRLPSYKLAYVSHWLGIGSKIETGGFSLWSDCLHGDEETKRKAWAKMARYCRQDTDLLEPLFKKLRPLFPASVNFAIFEGWDGELRCQKCGSADYLGPRGTAYTAQRAYSQHYCYPERGGCGGWTRDTKNSWSIASAGVVR